jgi:hypothetical protein
MSHLIPPPSPPETENNTLEYALRREERGEAMAGCRQYVTRVAPIGIAIGVVATAAGYAVAQPVPPVVVYSDQGRSAADRDTFYTTSQGSRMMPYAWFKGGYGGTNAVPDSDARAAFAHPTALEKAPGSGRPAST